jgi:hypothetical protein
LLTQGLIELRSGCGDPQIEFSSTGRIPLLVRLTASLNPGRGDLCFKTYDLKRRYPNHPLPCHRFLTLALR